MNPFIRYLAFPLALFAVLAAALAGNARRVGARADGLRVDVGGDASQVVDPSSQAPFSPFRFAVIGPVRGDLGALDRAFTRIDERGGADLVILLGDTTRSGTIGEMRALREAWADREHATIVLGGDVDRRADRAEAVQSWLGPQRWMFVRNDCRFIGVPGGDAADTAFVTAQAVPDATLVHTIQLRVDGAAGDGEVFATADALDQLGRDAGGALGMKLCSVTRGAIEVEHDAVARGPTLRALRRDLELNVLYPALGGSWAFGGFLVVCAGALGGAWVLWRRER